MEEEKIKKLTDEHLKVMFECRSGATIFGLREAMLLREVKKYDKDLITIVGISDLEGIVGKDNIYNNKHELAYFGAILTAKGKQLVNEWRTSNVK